MARYTSFLSSALACLMLTPTAFAQDACKDSATGAAKVEMKFTEGSIRGAFSQGVVLQGSNGEFYVSFEFSTNKASKVTVRPPMNLAIVVDRSGSMSGDKIIAARTAASELVAHLTDKDRVALIQYDDKAQVIVPSILTDSEGKNILQGAIEGIYPGGGTNLHDGLNEGIDEVAEYVAPGQVNRVILLSDGRANVGIVDPNEIANDASASAERGIKISSVGLGLDFNEDLMESIAVNGLGRYYYAATADQLDDVLGGELNGMQEVVATNAELRLQPGCAGVEIIQVFGYTPRKDGDTVIIPIPELSGGEKRKVMIKLKTVTEKEFKQDAFKASFSYQDTKGTKNSTKDMALSIAVSKDKKKVESSVDKKAMAQVVTLEGGVAIRQASEAYANGDTDGANNQMKEARKKVAAAKKTYNFSDDEINGELLKPLTDKDSAVNPFRAAPSSAVGKDSVKKNKSIANEAMY